MIKERGIPQNEAIGPLKIEGVAARNKILDFICPFLSGKVRESRARGLQIANDINREYGNIILPQDLEKLAFNHWRAGGLARYLNTRINNSPSPQDPRLSHIYESLAGCFINMIALSDSVIDEQRPSAEATVFLLENCANLVGDPDIFKVKPLPNVEKFKKMKAAFAYAQKTGKALQELERWAAENGKTEEFKACKSAFLDCAGKWKLGEEESILSQQDPLLGKDKYEDISLKKSLYVVLALVKVVIPLSDDASCVKQNTLAIIDRAKDIYLLQLLDDLEDLGADLPWTFTVSSYLMSKDGDGIDGIMEEKQEFLSLVAKAQILSRFKEKPGIDWRLAQLNKQMIGILQRTGIIQARLRELTSKEKYKKFWPETSTFLQQIPDPFRGEIIKILNSLFTAQRLYSRLIGFKTRIASI